jgi:hypothetical protein
MLATVLLALAAPLGVTAPIGSSSWFSADSPIAIWASRTHGLRQGERVRLYARSERDGYLVVLHAEPNGRVRVLFPLDPLEDNYMRGGTSYELRGRGGREALEIFDRSGYGTVLAAFSRDPFRFDYFMRGDHWDYTQLDIWRVSGDPEGHLLDLVERMATGRYDYDVLRYGVVGYIAHRSRPVRLSLYGAYWDDPYHGGVHVSVFLGGPRYYYRFYYRPILIHPVPVYYYGPYYHTTAVFVTDWYGPFFDPYLPYYWYPPAYYTVYYPRYYAYYSVSYPAYPYRAVPARYAGGYTFKPGFQPLAIEPRNRGGLGQAVTRRLVAAENFSAPGGFSARRTVVADRVASRPAEEPGSSAGRRVVGTAEPRPIQPVTGAQAESGRRKIVTEEAPAVSGAPRRILPAEEGRRRALSEGAQVPIAAPSRERSEDQPSRARTVEPMDGLRRLVPQARERIGLPASREDRVAGPPIEREGPGLQEAARRRVPVIRELQGQPEEREDRSARRTVVPRRDTGASLRISPRREGEPVASPQGWSSPYRVAEPVAQPRSSVGRTQPWQRPASPRGAEFSNSWPAVAAPVTVAPRVMVPEAPRAPQNAYPEPPGGRRRP